MPDTLHRVESRAIRHESEIGRFERVEGDPHPRLRGVVHRYCGYTHTATGQRVRRREVAQDQVTLILGFGPPLGVGGPGVEITEQHSFVTALSDSYAVIEHDALHGIQVDLSAGGPTCSSGWPCTSSPVCSCRSRTCSGSRAGSSWRA